MWQQHGGVQMKTASTINDLIFKIRDVRSGMYSSGGPRPLFTNVGKEFKTLEEAQTELDDAQNYLLQNNIIAKIKVYTKEDE